MNNIVHDEHSGEWHGSQQTDDIEHSPCLADVVAKGHGEALLRSMRVTPLHKRAWSTVDKLFAAGLLVLGRDGLEGFTVEKVADSANMTNQAAYRYVSSGEALLRATVRWWQGRNMHVFKQILDRAYFESDADMARLLVSGILSRFPDRHFLSRRILVVVARDYHELDYMQIPKLAAALRLAMQRSGLPEQNLSDAEIIAGLSALAGAIKMTFINDPNLMHGAAYHATLERLFLSILRR